MSTDEIAGAAEDMLWYEDKKLQTCSYEKVLPFLVLFQLHRRSLGSR